MQDSTKVACCPTPDPEARELRIGRCLKAAQKGRCRRGSRFGFIRNICPVACGVCTVCGPSDPQRALIRYQHAFHRRCAGNVDDPMRRRELRGSRDDSLLEDCVARCPANATPLVPAPVAMGAETIVVRAKPSSVRPPRSEEEPLLGAPTPLGGGLNNMLMQLSQLVELSCASNATLLLPQLRADPLRRTPQRSDVAALPFGSLFDVGFFRPEFRRCTGAPPEDELAVGASHLGGSATSAVVPPTAGACTLRVRDDALLTDTDTGGTRIHTPSAQGSLEGRRVRWVTPDPVNRSWPHSHALLACVYRALKPSSSVRRSLAQLEHRAGALAGPRYAAVHQPIQRDWWWESRICAPRDATHEATRDATLAVLSVAPFLRRCYTPRQVAAATAESRKRLGASGIVLLYAHDKVSPLGPAVCSSDFHPVQTLSATVGSTSSSRSSSQAATAHDRDVKMPIRKLPRASSSIHKLALPDDLPYTLRTAIELWLAVRAPAAFYGNSISSFSRGVALLRSTRRRGRSLPSFAYDCALSRALLDGRNGSYAPRLAQPEAESSPPAGGYSESDSSPPAGGYSTRSSPVAPLGHGRAAQMLEPPGFHHLRPLVSLSGVGDARCAPGGEDDLSEHARAARWYRRGAPALS